VYDWLYSHKAEVARIQATAERFSRNLCIHLDNVSRVAGGRPSPVVPVPLLRSPSSIGVGSLSVLTCLCPDGALSLVETAGGRFPKFDEIVASALPAPIPAAANVRFLWRTQKDERIIVSGQASLDYAAERCAREQLCSLNLLLAPVQEQVANGTPMHFVSYFAFVLSCLRAIPTCILMIIGFLFPYSVKIEGKKAEFVRNTGYLLI
jgi:hypothetical protein